MSFPNRSNSSSKKVTNVTRRTWDKETFEKKAKDRQLRDAGLLPDGDDDGTGDLSKRRPKLQEEFIPAPTGAAGPEGSQRAYLKSRKSRVYGIDNKIGSTEIISLDAATKSKTKANVNGTATITKSSSDDSSAAVRKVGVGWHCKICDCFLKDSHTYFDHINGRKHQRALGYSMQVERVSKEQMQQKLQQLTQEKALKDQFKTDEVLDLERIVQQKDEEERIRKEARQQRQKERRKKLSMSNQPYPSHEDNEDEQSDYPKSLIRAKQMDQPKASREDQDDESHDEEVNPDMVALMGFSGFGG